MKVVDKVSGAEQFFMDINGGVALQKYEIYKAILCNKLSKLGKEEVVRKIDNEWLDFFYKYRKKLCNNNDEQNDEEELVELRFIEHVIRFVYRLNHYGLSYTDIWKKDENGKYTKKMIYGWVMTKNPKKKPIYLLLMRLNQKVKWLQSYHILIVWKKKMLKI